MRKTTGLKLKIRRGEKGIMIILFIFALLTPLMIVYSNACLSSSNIEVEKLKKKIEKQENVNASLSMQVDELASLSTIQDVAKDNGLSYINDNVVVVD